MITEINERYIIQLKSKVDKDSGGITSKMKMIECGSPVYRRYIEFTMKHRSAINVNWRQRNN
jgi:hypothetical protein